ncbi:unnamed protein product [Gordionus sp. m RMFG-2023]|uniref:uncharacterized protein LOC135928861 n=1 Tax=Gordionus sp. m RMFG-2023 TaxID=3053472 RepID=UPI0030E5F3B1
MPIFSTNKLSRSRKHLCKIVVLIFLSVTSFVGIVKWFESHSVYIPVNPANLPRKNFKILHDADHGNESFGVDDLNRLEHGTPIRLNGSKIKYERVNYTDPGVCGEVCDINIPGRPAKFWPFVEKDVDCPLMMKKLTTADKKEWPPPKLPPAEMYDHFTMFGRMPLEKKIYYYLDNYMGKTRPMPITEKEIHIRITARALRIRMSTYGVIEEDILQMALTKYSHAVRDKVGLDFGSSDPWISTLALLNGAFKMYMFDYRITISLFDEIETLTQRELYDIWYKRSIGVPLYGARHPSEFTTREYGEVKEKGRPQPGFDFAISFSSIEHSGLGRYGDSLNPYGDLEAMAQIWCVMNPGSLLFLNVPFNRNRSSLVWNAHRIYGHDRLQHLTANWKVLDEFDGCKLSNGLNCDEETAMTSVLWVLERV